MKKSGPTLIAGGGLLDRRSFLLSGALFSTACSLSGLASENQSPSEKFSGTRPIWMRSPGTEDTNYGQPSKYEASTLRRETKTVPQTSIFSVWHSPIATQRGMITPSGLHFGVHHNGIPEIDPEKHQLMIHGLVEKPLKFDLDDISRYPMVSRVHFIECGGNTAPNAVSLTALDLDCQDLFGQTSCSIWTGVPLKHLLNEAKIEDDASWAIVEGADGGSHSRSLPVSKLMQDAFIALYQNGERIRPSQGYPMRLFVPGWEGNVNVKWIHRIEVTDRPAYTKDESGLYSEVLKDDRIEHFTFPMGVKSVITHPSGKQLLPEKKGFYEIAGLAWSGHGKIARVEVSADAGKSWADSKLDPPVLNRAFTSFSIPWYWDGTPTTLISRAWDSEGNTQPDRDHWKSRYASHTFNHYNAIQAWKIEPSGLIENTYV